MITTAAGRAKAKYRAKAYDRIEVLVEKGDKDKIKFAAEQAGQSLNAFINTAIQERMQKSTEN